MIDELELETEAQPPVIDYSKNWEPERRRNEAGQFVSEERKFGREAELADAGFLAMQRPSSEQFDAGEAAFVRRRMHWLGAASRKSLSCFH